MITISVFGEATRSHYSLRPEDWAPATPRTNKRCFINSFHFYPILSHPIIPFLPRRGTAFRAFGHFCTWQCKGQHRPSELSGRAVVRFSYPDTCTSRIQGTASAYFSFLLLLSLKLAFHSFVWPDPDVVLYFDRDPTYPKYR